MRIGLGLLLIGSGLGLFGMIMAFQPAFTPPEMKGAMPPDAALASQGWMAIAFWVTLVPAVPGLLLALAGLGLHVKRIFDEEA